MIEGQHMSMAWSFLHYSEDEQETQHCLVISPLGITLLPRGQRKQAQIALKIFEVVSTLPYPQRSWAFVSLLPHMEPF